MTMAAVEAPVKIRWTAEAYLDLPDDGKLYEVLDGELIMAAAPNLWHQRITGKIYRLLCDWVIPRLAGTVLISPVDVVLGDDLAEPDVVYVSHERQAILTEERIV